MVKGWEQPPATLLTTALDLIPNKLVETSILVKGHLSCHTFCCFHHIWGSYRTWFPRDHGRNELLSQPAPLPHQWTSSGTHRPWNRYSYLSLCIYPTLPPWRTLPSPQDAHQAMETPIVAGR